MSRGTTLVTAPTTHTTVVVAEEPKHVVVTRGIPGPVGDAGGALLVSNRLSELSTDPAAQTEAQANLGLGTVDPLAYYILAKA